MERIAVRTAKYYKTYQLLLFVLTATALFASINILPLKASALEIGTQTQQILPPGSNTCAPVTATNFTPYIYDGALHSFEFTLADPSYVAILGSVGNTPIPFQVMTRNVSPTGILRIHVDIATTPIVGTLPLRVTLLSARTGQPVCLAAVSMSVGSGPVQNNNVISAIPQTVYTSPQTVYTSPNAVKPTTPRAPSVVAPTITASTSSNSTIVATSSGDKRVATVASSVTSTVQSPLRNVCSSDTSAYRLWLILLVLYALIVGAALWAEFPMSMPWARTPERIATVILLLLLLLLGFWYFSVSCRAALWMPLVAFLIAVLGLLAAFWNHPRVTQLLLVQDAKTK